MKDKELDLAMMLVESLTSEWAPDKYKDEYRENLMKVIKAKLKGKEPKLKATDHLPGQAEVIDLMERLRESLGASKARAKAASQEQPLYRAQAHHGPRRSDLVPRPRARARPRQSARAKPRKGPRVPRIGEVSPALPAPSPRFVYADAEKGILSGRARDRARPSGARR